MGVRNAVNDDIASTIPGRKWWTRAEGIIDRLIVLITDVHRVCQRPFMWSTSHLHGPRRSHEQSHNEVKRSRSSSPDDGIEPRRRTSSDATPRQTPATTRFLNTAIDQDASRSVLPSTTSDRSEGFSSAKRLGFLADKLTSSLSSKESSSTLKGSLHPSQLLHPHSHSRTESNPSPSPSPAPGLMASTNMSSSSKPHTSPSKASYGRTYDSKLVTREMHRLGNLVPSGLAPQLSTAPSVASMALPAAGGISQTSISSSSNDESWGVLHVHVLPLFNGEPLRIPMQVCPIFHVKRHIQSAVSSAPSRAIAQLETDASELIAAGMVTLNAKLTGIDDEKLVARVVEIWGFFWDQVLTYLEGQVLLPLQTDPLLSSLYRTPKSHRATSPTRQTGSKPPLTTTSSSKGTNHIDVRSVALRSFRDRVILPPYQRLYARLSLANRQDTFQETASYQQPRLQQMLLVLSSETQHSPPTFSLTKPAPPQLTAGEAAVKELLRLVRSPRPQSEIRNQKYKNAPGFPNTFMSGGPRDRRGRVAHKGKSVANEEDLYGEETPRLGSAGYVVEIEREREREFLEALRSPDIEPSGPRTSSGGWGLGAGNVENGKLTEEEEEDEPLDWDQAQAVVERMVGMNTRK
ncbi:hypothetical protein CVT26_015704 [Gymnopilus dilepis]|uniref:HbrB-like protein n=1 Tax=Gymnopilus dilepis TaxID=231916 RepID=A0A409VFH1_9AGAR|nr:hypothetical protein CVT26_015704 [Gymnopilus dilepis]